jgi:hypothetical protein
VISMLGTLYHPKALALETAKAVLQVDDPYAVNPALGCENGCLGCYGPLAFHKHDWDQVKIATEEARVKFERQVRTGIGITTLVPHTEGVFMAFGTDPFLPAVEPETRYRVYHLLNQHEHIKVALLSKLLIPPHEFKKLGCEKDYVRIMWEGYIAHDQVLNGKSIVSFDEEYYKVYEPKAATPQKRLEELLVSKHPWISCEPYPPPAIHKQVPEKFLETLLFQDWKNHPEVIVFGMRNYDKRALTEEAREYYRDAIKVFERVCTKLGIRLHVKSDTLSYVRGE